MPDRHRCIKIWLVFAIMVWEMNKTKTCTCQGHKAKKEGACYSFGCSWNVYHDSCKYAKRSTRIIRKYRLANESQEEEI